MKKVISYCFTDPSYRHRGVGSLAMKWGLAKADELGLDIFVESTEDGRGFYEAHGFEVFDDFSLDASTATPSKEFTQQTAALQLPLHGYYMKRPFIAKST
jgi:N-acetylglutamate synthase-like GNAT family acetyltransferase